MTNKPLQIRLMNVAQVRGRHGECSYDVRPDCVEIRIDANGGTLTMLRLRPPGDDALKGDITDPCMLGKINIRGDCALHGPADDFDMLARYDSASEWLVHGHEVALSIRPYKDEDIWVDGGFHRLPKPLAGMHDERRSLMLWLIDNQRLLRATPESEAKRRGMTLGSIQVIEQQLLAVDLRIRRHCGLIQSK